MQAAMQRIFAGNAFQQQNLCRHYKTCSIRIQCTFGSLFQTFTKLRHCVYTISIKY